MTSVAASVAICLANYGHLISIITESASPLHGQLELSALQDELGRFKVWAGNIAAHKTGRSSLDFRLRDATPLRERILGLLSDMSELLQEGSQIAAGDRVPRDEILSDSDSSDEEGSVQSDHSENTTTELQQIFLDVVVCIDCLYKLSITIRSGVSAHDRLVKATSIDTSFYETWDIQHVKSKFPDIKESLAIRLGKSISRRRQHFKYYEKHHRKLAQDLISPQIHLKLSHAPQAIEILSETLPDPPNNVDIHPEEVMINLPNTEAEPSIAATTVLTQTTASEFVGGTADFEVESDSGQTSTSYGTTVLFGGRLSIPPLPRDAVDGRPFECPYCFIIVSITNLHAWKKHIFRDLQPYVCTFEKCAKASKMFDSRREWFDHELASHRREWFCTADCQLSFKVQAEFEAHMKSAHQISSQAQLNALADMCQRPIDEDAGGQCPLCMETLLSIKQLCRHLARHLEQLALFALPHSNDDEKVEEFDSAKPQVSDISRELSDENVTFSSNSDPDELLSNPDPIPDINISDDDDSNGVGDADLDDNDNGDDDPALDILRDANASQNFKLPASFLPLFNQRLEGIIDGTDISLEYQDTGFIHLFTDLSQALAGKHVQRLLKSEGRVSDLIVMVYLHARKCFQKRLSADDQGIWESLVDRARVHFIDIISDTIAKSSRQEEDVSELIKLLDALEAKFNARLHPHGGLKANRKTVDVIPDQDWDSYWGLGVRDIQSHSQKETERQRAIHNLWLSEKEFVNSLVVCLTAYHEELVHDPSIMQNGQPFEFVEVGFTAVGGLRELHEIFLFALENKIKTQGPWVHDLSDVIQDWIARATPSYIHYVKTFPMVEWLIQSEAAQNPQFKKSFYPDTAKLDWLRCLRSPVIRVQQYMSLLIAIRPSNKENTEEESKFEAMIEKVKTFTEGFKSIENHGRAKVRLHELGKTLTFKHGLKAVELQLDEENRQLLFEGELERLRSASVGVSTTNHALLFDNYFILAKPINSGDAKMYSISKPPIPMALLVLEDANDNNKISPILSDTEGNERIVPQSMTPGEETRRPGFSPFIIRNLKNRETYTLLVETEAKRKEWCENIVRAKVLYATMLREKKVEPFALNVLSNGYFQNIDSLRLNRYSEIQGSPLSQAIKGAEPAPSHTVVRTGVKCGSTFKTTGRSMAFIATKYAFFIIEKGMSFGVPIPRFDLPEITQLVVIEELSIIIVLASKSIYSYSIGSLETVHPDKELPKAKLLDDVELFRLGKKSSNRPGEREIISLFCAIRQATRTKITELELYLLGPRDIEGTSSPPVCNSRNKNEFYAPKDCYDIAIFDSLVVIMSSQGFDIMAQQIPALFAELQFPEGERPALGLFRLPEGMAWGETTEYLLCVLENYAFYIGQFGKRTGRPPITYVGPAVSVASYGYYLILFHDDFVEIRDVTNGKLCQIITGQNIRYLEGGREQGRNVTFVMAHPNMEGRELVLELVLSDDGPPRDRTRAGQAFSYPVTRAPSVRRSKTSGLLDIRSSRSSRVRNEKVSDDPPDKPNQKCTVS